MSLEACKRTPIDENGDVEGISVEILPDDEAEAGVAFVGRVCTVHRGEKIEDQKAGNYL